MSIPILQNADFNKNQLLNVLLQIIAGNHGSPVEGLIWYDSTAKRVKYRDDADNEVVVAQSVLDTAVALLQPVSEKGANNGYASLDGSGKVPASQLTVTASEYKGTWNATTNTPALADGAGSTGDFYRVSTGGSQDLGSGSITFVASDIVIYNGTVWEKIDTTDAVASVNGQIGAVQIDADDVPYAGGTGMSATHVEGAIDELATEKANAADVATDAELAAHTGDATGAHAASAIAFTPAGTIAASDVQAAIEEVAAEAGAGSLDKFADDITGDAVATQFTVTHNLGTKDVSISVYDVSGDLEVLVDKKRPTINTVRIDFAQAPANAKVYRVVVIG